jgi:hypothetical protein
MCIINHELQIVIFECILMFFMLVLEFDTVYDNHLVVNYILNFDDYLSLLYFTIDTSTRTDSLQF